MKVKFRVLFFKFRALSAVFRVFLPHFGPFQGFFTKIVKFRVFQGFSWIQGSARTLSEMSLIQIMYTFTDSPNFENSQGADFCCPQGAFRGAVVAERGAFRGASLQKLPKIQLLKIFIVLTVLNAYIYSIYILSVDYPKPKIILEQILQ